jgi:hypothetical protein
MNMKGTTTTTALERYPMIDAYNMAPGAQQRLIEEALSRTRTHPVVAGGDPEDTHVENLTAFVELLRRETGAFIIVAGGRG